MEAALRTAYEKMIGETLGEVEFKDVRDVDYGVEEIKAGNPNNNHAIEIMVCPGGCIDGGGQPYHHGDQSILDARRQALLDEDAAKPIRKSHENPSVVKSYEEYYKEPGLERAHHQPHTTYTRRDIYAE